MDPGPELSAAIDAAYEVFAGYSCPQQMEASPARDPARLAVLSSAPLRELTGEQIGPYAGWALTTVGSVTDYKYFLPRILEQSVRAPRWLGTQSPIIAERLKLADWRTWPPVEQAVLLRFFQTAWREAIRRHPDEGADASEWLCGLAAIGENVAPLLLEWAGLANGAPLLHIAELATALPHLVSHDPREQTFWSYVAPEVRSEIASWLVSADVRSALSGAAGVSQEDSWQLERGEKALTDYAALARR